jgi:hypothetical protein
MEDEIHLLLAMNAAGIDLSLTCYNTFVLVAPTVRSPLAHYKFVGSTKLMIWSNSQHRCLEVLIGRCLASRIWPGFIDSQVLDMN